MIRTGFCEIVKEVDELNAITDMLFSERVFESDRIEKLNTLATKQERCRAMVNAVLQSSHPRSCIVLSTALQKHYQHLSCKLGLDKVLDSLDTNPVINIKVRIEGKDSSNFDLINNNVRSLLQSKLTGEVLQESATLALLKSSGGEVTEIRKGCTELCVSCPTRDTLKQLRDVCMNGQLRQSLLSDISKFELCKSVPLSELDVLSTINNDDYRACYAVLLAAGMYYNHNNIGVTNLIFNSQGQGLVSIQTIPDLFESEID